VPVLASGLLITPAALEWLRGRFDIFDARGLFGVFGFHFFFLAPLLNVALNYSGRAELVDTFNRLLHEFSQNGHKPQISEETISNFLYTSGIPDPDLLIRTSGEMRISNFLLWQIAYSEIYITSTYWPDFRRKHLLEAILEYQQRDRRYGGI